MGRLPIARGPISEHVGANLLRLRVDRHLTVQALSAQLEAVGRTMRADTITKIELGTRRADVDDLVALALALDASPLVLLLPPYTGSSQPVSLTTTLRIKARDAWRWASGEHPLPDSGGVVSLASKRRFRAEGRPHLPPELSLAELSPEAGVALGAVARATNGALAAGLNAHDVAVYAQFIANSPEVEIPADAWIGQRPKADRG